MFDFQIQNIISFLGESHIQIATINKQWKHNYEIVFKEKKVSSLYDLDNETFLECVQKKYINLKDFCPREILNIFSYDQITLIFQYEDDWRINFDEWYAYLPHDKYMDVVRFLYDFYEDFEIDTLFIMSLTKRDSFEIMDWCYVLIQNTGFLEETDYWTIAIKFSTMEVLTYLYSRSNYYSKEEFVLDYFYLFEDGVASEDAWTFFLLR